MDRQRGESEEGVEREREGENGGWREKGGRER